MTGRQPGDTFFPGDKYFLFNTDVREDAEMYLTAGHEAGAALGSAQVCPGWGIWGGLGVPEPPLWDSGIQWDREQQGGGSTGEHPQIVHLG